MTEPTYDDFYPASQPSGLTPAQEAGYNLHYPGTFAEPAAKPTALEALGMALDAMKLGDVHDLSHAEPLPAQPMSQDDMRSTRAMVPDRNAPHPDLDPEYDTYFTTNKETN